MHRRRRSDRAGAGAGLSELLPPSDQQLLFAAAVLVLNATPGVDLLLTLSRTAGRGWRAGAAAAAGIAAGSVLHALAAAFGLAALLAVLPAAFTAIQWAGAAYLAWLGAGLLLLAWRGVPASAAVATGGGGAASAWRDAGSGLLTNLLNPKVALFFLSFLPQFVPASSADKTASFLLLGGWFVAQSLVFLLCVVALATFASRHRVPHALRRALAALSGVLFIGLALRLLRTRPLVT